VSAVLTVVRTGNVSVPASVDYTTVDGTASAGADYTESAGTLAFAAWESTRTITVPVAEDTLVEGAESLTVMLGNAAGATLGTPSLATLNLTDNDYSISGQVTLESGTPLSDVPLSATGAAACTSSDVSGAYTRTVPLAWSGTIIPALSGFRFTQAWRNYTGVSANLDRQDYSAAVQADTAWVDDALPTGAHPVGTWNFISANPVPFSGSLAHQSILATGVHQHYFTGAASALVVNAGETLFTYVHLDPGNPPGEVMLQWLEAGSTAPNGEPTASPGAATAPRAGATWGRCRLRGDGHAWKYLPPQWVWRTPSLTGWLSCSMAVRQPGTMRASGSFGERGCWR